MADITKLKAMIETYGIGVRAGVLTPCLQDENEFRKLLGLQPAPVEVAADWASTEGIRRPITLAGKADAVLQNQPMEGKDDNAEQE